MHICCHIRVLHIQLVCAQNTSPPSPEDTLFTWVALPVSIYLQCDEHWTGQSILAGNLKLAIHAVISLPEKHGLPPQPLLYKLGLLPSFCGLPGNIFCKNANHCEACPDLPRLIHGLVCSAHNRSFCGPLHRGLYSHAIWFESFQWPRQKVCFVQWENTSLTETINIFGCCLNSPAIRH